MRTVDELIEEIEKIRRANIDKTNLMNYSHEDRHKHRKRVNELTIALNIIEEFKIK